MKQIETNRLPVRSCQGAHFLVTLKKLAPLNAQLAIIVLLLFSRPATAEFLGTFELGDVGSTIAGAKITTTNPDAFLGVAVSSVGDLNADGIDDFVLSGPGGAGVIGISTDIEGAAYIVFGVLGGIGGNGAFDVSSIGSSISGIALLGSNPGDRAGYQARGAGDVNGDGIVDLILSSSSKDSSGFVNNGAVYVVYGGSHLNSIASLNLEDVGTPTGIPGFQIAGTATTDLLGFDVAPAGDVDGDSFQDILVSLYGLGFETYLVYGSVTLPSQFNLSDIGDVSQPGTTVSGTKFFTSVVAGEAPGWSVGTVGDIDGDGFSDYAIGDVAKYHPSEDVYGSPGQPGSTYVLYGSTNRPAQVDVVDIASAGPGASGVEGFEYVGSFDHMGFAIGAGNDFNSDGFDDALLSESGTELIPQAGSAHVVFGNPVRHTGRILGRDAPANGIAARYIGDVSPGQEFGTSLQGAGDFNGDGHTDIVLGSREYCPYPANAIGPGKAYVLYGGPHISTGQLTFPTDFGTAIDGAQFVGEITGDGAGFEIAGMGDYNGDGLGDILVGAPNYSQNSGAVYLVYGQRGNRVTWIGKGMAGDWNDPFNWLGHQLPDADDSVELSSGLTLTVGQLTLGGGVGPIKLSMASRNLILATEYVLMSAGSILEGPSGSYAGLIGPAIVNRGEIRPGGIDETGTLIASSLFVQMFDGKLSIDWAGNQDADLLIGGANSTISLSGLLSLNMVDGYIPNYYDSVAIIDADSVVGKFSNIDGVQQGAYSIAVDYQSDKVLLVAALIGDVDLDGSVTQSDLDTVLFNWGNYGATWRTGDLDGDGMVSQADLDAVLSSLGGSL